VKQFKSLILSASTLFVIPALILLLFRTTRFGINMFSPVVQIVAGSAICLIGVALVVITIRMFIIIGRGTLAPWDPPLRLVTEGIYSHVRNPMISGVLITLLGESLAVGSLGILAWAGFFFLINSAYFYFSEEKGLERRFGEEYIEYKRNVPRWLPRLKPRKKAGGE